MPEADSGILLWMGLFSLSMVPICVGESCPQLLGSGTRPPGNLDHGQLKNTYTITALGRSRPAADASREVVECWLLYGL